VEKKKLPLTPQKRGPLPRHQQRARRERPPPSAPSAWGARLFPCCAPWASPRLLSSFQSNQKHRLHGRDQAARAQHSDCHERALGSRNPPLEGPPVCHRAGVQEAGADEEGGDAGEHGAGEQRAGLDESELDEDEGGVPVSGSFFFSS